VLAQGAHILEAARDGATAGARWPRRTSCRRAGGVVLVAALALAVGGGGMAPGRSGAAVAPPGHADPLVALRAAAGGGPLWVDAAGRPDADARQALAVLAAAGNEGLDPADYRAKELARAAAALAGGAPPAPADVAAFEEALGAAMLRYLRHLHEGRVDPRAVGFRMVVPAEAHDYAEVLGGAVARHRVAEVAAALAPPVRAYTELRAALARYRVLGADPALAEPPDVGEVLRPGDTHAGIAGLRRLLVALGDLPPESPAPSAGTYEGALVDGVRRFQERHGLEVDGIVGRATRGALAVPLAWRARQIELALERLRWLPDLGPEPSLAVNIPMFRLAVWNAAAGAEPPGGRGRPQLTMGVIVGRALRTQTPVFVDRMERVIFRPYWNVPLSIARGEIVPAARRDPSYLRRNDMEIVAGQSDEARPVAPSAESLAAVASGALRVRQRPGPNNALGLVKFVFPNDANVYLHGTPAQQLFQRPRRDFSHGCVRVEDPVALAEWVLAGQGDWTRERVLAAMHAERSLQVTLERPVEVILFYVTALPRADGAVRFAEDIYGHDARLDRALVSSRGLAP
jgi:murein L,D-transpeptidase YcbB/YkuD